MCMVNTGPKCINIERENIKNNNNKQDVKQASEPISKKGSLMCKIKTKTNEIRNSRKKNDTPYKHY